jgi:hypothetical protein
MAKFVTYAEILTPDHIQWQAYKSGIKKNPPGVVLKDILERTGGTYEIRIDLSQATRDQVRRVAELTADEELLSVANQTAVTVSLDHLRDVDPQTRIVCGYRLDYTAEESERLGLNQKGAYDPRKTITVDLDPTNPIRVKRG